MRARSRRDGRARAASRSAAHTVATISWASIIAKLLPMHRCGPPQRGSRRSRGARRPLGGKALGIKDSGWQTGGAGGVSHRAGEDERAFVYRTPPARGPLPRAARWSTRVDTVASTPEHQERITVSAPVLGQWERGPKALYRARSAALQIWGSWTGGRSPGEHGRSGLVARREHGDCLIGSCKVRHRLAGVFVPRLHEHGHEVSGIRPRRGARRACRR